MTTARDNRVAALTSAAKARTQAKTKAAEQGLRALIKRGEPISFQAVQREAGVSHAFLYNHPDLRGRIERLRGHARPNATPPATPEDSESTLVLALTTQINNLKQQHRQEVQTLRAALEQAHGENLDLRRELARRGRTPTALPDPAGHVASIATTS